MDARTAELYSEQGNTDLTELTVINERTQCENGKEHGAKGDVERNNGGGNFSSGD